VALEFQAMVENVVQILIGCPLDFQAGTGGGQKKAYYFKSKHPNNPHHKGIFGHVTAVCGCIETQARGALHIHVVIYGGLKPRLLEDCVGFDGLCHAVTSILDSMYVLLLLTHGLVSFKQLYWLCRYALSAFVPPSVIPNLQKNIWQGQAIKQLCE
jgi:hypothetical protein